MSGIVIRPVEADIFRTAMDWAAAEGWNPGLDDLPAFHASDPQGFLMAFAGERPIASISVVRYGESFGFLGFYIVHPEHRGQGAGMAIWQAGMAHLEARTVGLDGVVDQQENYRKSGFVLAGRNVRFAGPPPAPLPRQNGINTRPAGPSDIAAITAYDRPFFPGDRAGFVRQWIAPDRPARRICHVAEEDGSLQGYGVIRVCREGYKIGPLFAETKQAAEALFSSLCRNASRDGPVILDVPDDNLMAVSLAEDLGLKPAFETARMYRGPAPDLPLFRIFGITSFELG